MQKSIDLVHGKKIEYWEDYVQHHHWKNVVKYLYHQESWNPQIMPVTCCFHIRSFSSFSLRLMGVIKWRETKEVVDKEIWDWEVGEEDDAMREKENPALDTMLEREKGKKKIRKIYFIYTSKTRRSSPVKNKNIKKDMWKKSTTK